MSSELITRIRDDVQRLVRRAADHEECVHGLLRTADTEAREAESALTQARGDEQPRAADWQRACATRAKRSRHFAASTRRACLSARQQHVAALRLRSRLADSRAQNGPGPESHAAGVLVVDDVEEVRELIAGVLRDAGFLVRTAVNGLDALISAYEMQPAVIVMDMMMPVLNGIEATRLIKATEATRTAKVIAYTANPSLPDVVRDRLFVAVLAKPSTPDDVLATVQNVARL